ncbi:hypothetical protein [Nocardia wallacei]|uniref:hypothetical protein n=1 Tax=Nocardia wallacei TaxID=480035 RepID=UPI0024579F33|nr:hypothetical protein [Nocardia wallacei]
MPRDARLYITVAVDMDRNPKYAALNDAQKFLIIRAWLHCREYLTDGVVSMPVWRKMGTDRNRKAVLASGACSVDAEQNGVVFHDYLEHQQSRADVEAAKEKARSAGKKGGLTKAANARREAGGSTSRALALARETPSGSVPEIEIDKEITTYVGSASNVSNARAFEPADDDAIEAAVETPGPVVPIDGRRLVRSKVSFEHPPAVHTELSIQAAAMLKAGTTPETIEAALDLWLTKPHLGPKTLPSLVSEVIRGRTQRPNMPQSAYTLPKNATGDEIQAAAEAAKAEALRIYRESNPHVA